MGRQAWRSRRGWGGHASGRASWSGTDKGERLRGMKAPISVVVRDRAGDETLDEDAGQIAEGRRGLGTVAGARATAVLVVAQITDVVEGLGHNQRP